MVFSITWSESSPQGTAAANTLDTIIQQLKTSVRERLQLGGTYWPSDHDELAGEHSYVRLAEQSDYPAAVSNKGHLLAKDASGVSELHYMDDAGAAAQLTVSGKLNAAALGGVYGVTNLASLVNILPYVYPVGSIYISAVSTSPATLFGFGTWTATGTGKVLVGIDSGDTDFDVAGETGGSKTVSTAHTHTVPASSAVWGQTTSTGGKLTTGQDGGTSASTDASTSSSGGTVSVVQPYVVVYMWQRTA